MLILHNTQIYILKEGQPTATALVIDDHTPHTRCIIAGGDDRAILKGFSQRSEEPDIVGLAILPGFTEGRISNVPG